MAAEGFALWLLKVAGGQAIKDALGRRGLRAQVRSLQKALQDSQDERAELRDIADLIGQLSADRDLLQAEVVRLRVENVELRRRVDAFGDDGPSRSR